MTTKPASKTPKNSTRIRLDDLCAWLANQSFSAQCKRLDKRRSWMQRSRFEGESEAYTAALAKVREVFAQRISPPTGCAASSGAQSCWICGRSDGDLLPSHGENAPPYHINCIGDFRAHLVQRLNDLADFMEPIHVRIWKRIKAWFRPANAKSEGPPPPLNEFNPEVNGGSLH